MKQRIWELDVFRGICIVGMVLFHLMYDLQHLLSWLPAGNTGAVQFIADWGGVLFFLLSGICATLGSRPVRRGLVVFGCGMVITAVTAVMADFGWLSQSVVIRFGVLHCLGLCMLLWPLTRKLGWPWLLCLGFALVGVGFWLDRQVFPGITWLFPLGVKYPGFASGDYFPLLLFFGFFLVGAAVGKTLYRNGVSLFPNVNTNALWIRAFSRVGRWSLPVYMLHQPLITGILTLLEELL